MRLENKVAVITGAASGIGRATALLFAREGASVVIGDIDDAGGKNVAAEIGAKAIYVHADVTQEIEAQHLIKACIEKFGRVDILFNNAGIIQNDKPIDEMEEALWDRVYDVNIKSMFLVSKHAVREMKQVKRGVIINCGSMGFMRPRMYRSAYSSSKGAVDSFTRAIALELAPFGIRACTVNPVVTDTQLVRNAIDPGINQDEYMVGVGKSLPLGRMAQPEDIAYAVLYLASDEAAMITGSSLNVSAGREL